MSTIAAVSDTRTNQGMNTTLRPLPTFVASPADYSPPAPKFVSTAICERPSAPLAHVRVVGAQPRLDSSMRISLGKAAEALNWDSTTELFANNDGEVIVITEAEAHQKSNVRLGEQARLGLNPGALFALGATKASQVQVIADLDHNRLVLVSLDTVLTTILKELDR